MEAYRRTFFTGRGIAVRRGATPLPNARPLSGEHAGHDEIDLISGAMHYWRVDRRDWSACLAAMQQLGLRIVETYVPWSVHELGPQRFDWTGERDLGRFLDAVAAAGMLTVVRPGPHINAEITLFGFPRRVLERSELLARTARATPVWLPAPPRAFPVPSYASAAFQDEVKTWLAAVAEIITPRLAPDGPVIAVQVDNEAQMFFRLGAYDHDYHPDALAWWQEHSGYEQPPRAWSEDDAARCVAWVRFKDEYVARSLAWNAAALDQIGLGGVARFHNLPPSPPHLVDLPRAARALGDLVGMDFYHRAQEHEHCRRRALYLVGSASPLPFAPEIGMGAPPWFPPTTDRDSQMTLLGALSAGVRAFNLYMTVERERWYGAPLSERGAARPLAAWLRAVLAALDEVGWTGLRRRAPVALISARADARFAVASSAVDPITPVVAELLELGPAGSAELALDHDAAAHRRWLAAVEQALALAQVPYEIVDEAAGAATLARYRAVVAPTLRRVDRALWRDLHQLAQQGTIVVLGPGRPTLDELGQPLDTTTLPPRAGLIRPGSLDDVAGLADDLAGLAADLPDLWLAEDEAVDCSLFEDAGGAPRVLFVASRADAPVSASVRVPAAAALREPTTGADLIATEDGALTVALQPHEIRMLIVTRS